MTDQYFGLTDTGRQRKNNEDTFIAQLSADNKFIIACVIDGVGGYSGGEIAAELARESIVSRLNKPSGEIIPILIDCLNLANEKIIQEKLISKEHDSMACVCTLAIVDIERNQFYFAHVGDTRLYLVRDNSLVKISHDQSFVGFLEDSGRLSEAEAMSHPKRNEINKALGLDNQLPNDNDYFETGQSPFLPGDMLLLCSDGLTDMVDSATIGSIITTNEPLKEKSHQLINAANESGGRDNITVVLVQNNKAPLQHDATRPAANSKKDTDTIVNTVESPEQISSKPGRPMPVAKSNKTPVVVLSILTLIFLATSIWEFLQNNKKEGEIQEQPYVMVRAKKPKNQQEIKLQRAIDQLKGHTITLSDTAYPAPIIISDAIQINKDTLLIKATGKVVLQCDSGYTGPALSLTSKCKSIGLDSLSLIDFKVGVAAVNNAVSLKNTRFIRCSVPLQTAFTFADKKYVNAKISSVFFKVDSIPVLNK